MYRGGLQKNLQKCFFFLGGGSCRHYGRDHKGMLLAMIPSPLIWGSGVWALERVWALQGFGGACKI